MFARVCESCRSKLPAAIRIVEAFRVLFRERRPGIATSAQHPSNSAAAALNARCAKNALLALKHTFTASQIEWFRKGSALNTMQH